MPSFGTPEPVSVTAHVGAGSIRFTVDRPDTVVEVRPGNPRRDKDVQAAEQTEVAYASGVLTVRTKERRLYRDPPAPSTYIGPSGAVDVTVELPTGSRVGTAPCSSVIYTPRRGGAPAAVSTIGPRKSYGDKTVLDVIDLRIPAGSVFALLGPNGAGKTTTGLGLDSASHDHTDQHGQPQAPRTPPSTP